MSSAILAQFSPPTLSYRGAVDVYSAQYGSTMYNLFYDASLVSLGSVLMFEVKTIASNITVPNDDNVTLSFISMENAVNTGISNMWQISVPSLNNVYEPSVAIKIAVRLYIGQTGTAEVGVTEWSNELNVYNPPPQPLIDSAFYNTPGDEDDLYIFLKDASNNYDYTKIKFVAAFYYQDLNNATVWDVSVPVDAIGISGNLRMIHVPDFGFVSTDPSYSVMYTSLYAVYEFKDDSNNNFYSVSQVSDTVDARPAADLPPVVDSINYAVYELSQDETMTGSQTMTVNWTAPLNQNIPAFNVDFYNVYVSNDMSNNYVFDSSYASAPGTTAYSSSPINVSDRICGQTVYFKVQAVLIDGSTSPLSETTNNSQLKIFKYAAAPTDLVITNTAYVNGTVDMSINFVAPSDNGCGTPLYFRINVTSGNLSIDNSLNYTASGNYSYSFSGSVGQTGIVKVYLVTEDTNPSIPGATTYPDRYGAFITTPYIATNLVLNDVHYQVYDNPASQNMDLSWNNPVAGLLGGWSVNGYEVQYQIQDVGTQHNNDDWTTPLDGSNLTSTSYTFDASFVNCDKTVYFRIIADLENTVPNPDVPYEVTSNVVSKNMFRYAQAPTNLVITNTAYVNETVDMSINFVAPSDNGCGTPLYFRIEVISNGAGQSIDNSLNYTASGNYSYSFSGAVGQTGIVKVYLVTEDTNPSIPGATTYPDRYGAFITTPYIATNLVLNDVHYQVYDNPASQNMDLSWNNPVIGLLGGWSVNGYEVQYQTQNVGTPPNNDDWITPLDGSNLSLTSYTFDASFVECNKTVYFRIIADLSNNTPDPDVPYEVTSNVVSKNMFRYAQAPTNLVITNTAYNVNETVDMSINFVAPSDKGCGDSLYLIINVTSGNLSIDNSLNYTASGNYSYSFSGAVGQTGIVKVYLVTKDTNLGPDGSTYPDRYGAFITTPYIATNLVLDDVHYRVYDEPIGSQNMDLSWNSQVVSPWSLVNYQVYYQVNNGIWNNPYSGPNIIYTFDASEAGVATCGNTINFYVKATLQNGTTQYEATSNTQSINIFKFADAPASLNVLWASADASSNYMDIRAVFTNPNSTGCGTVQDFVVNVRDAAGNILQYYDSSVLATMDVSYNGTSSYTYTVNFNNVTYSSTGNVEVYLVTKDTNEPSDPQDGTAITASFTASRLPIYQNVSMNSGRTLLTFDVITQTHLVLVNGAITGKVVNGQAVLTGYYWNSDGSTTGVSVVETILPNNEIKYSISMNTTFLGIGVTEFPNPFGLIVSNEVGIKEYNVDGSNP